MPDLATMYMGLKLNSPVIVGACSLSKRTDKIKAAQDAGAGALVIKSLFEEQIQMEAVRLAESLAEYENMIVESLSFHPRIEHGGPQEFLSWIEKTRREVSMPLIASLNAVSPGAWTEFAIELENTGIDALELNLYAVITDPRVGESQVLDSMLETVRSVKSKVKIPVSVKLSPYFASPGFAIQSFDETGIEGLVFFNRFAQPNVNVKEARLYVDMSMSDKNEQGHTLRWIGLMHGKTRASLCASTGIHDADDVLKMLLAGADAVQVVSAIYLHGLNYIHTINDGISSWMKEKGYISISEFKGKLSKSSQPDPFAFERAQYIKALLGFD